MGYDTRYALVWTATLAWVAQPLCGHPKAADALFCSKCGKPNQNTPLNVVVAEYISEHAEMAYAINEDGSSRTRCKWYEHTDDLTAMSKAIPNVLFHLSGEGDDTGDIWDAFAVDGKVQKHPAQIVRMTAPDPSAWGKAGP